MTKTDYIQYIETNTLRCEASYRGGGIEIDLGPLLGVEDYAMTAYQNYPGGGMLGSIQNSYNFDVKKESFIAQEMIGEITEALNRYFHNLTNHESDE